ncbi:MAG TPA: Rne/Rng family ribonuclease [Microbacteriaceae bacterium]|nr:Rne/Rng family ribonuclease [Microbacteriaceae bacterium]
MVDDTAAIDAADESTTTTAAEAAPAAHVTATSLLFLAPPAPAHPPVLPDDEDGEEAGGGRTRSRRRRSSGDAESAAPQSTQRQRSSQQGQQRRQRVAEPITEPQKVKGSTRLEAKKQRRRDGRDSGRRRTVVTESEFLARREAVDRSMIVRAKHDRIQVAVLEDDVLVEHYVAKSQEASLIGNIYLGRVQNVLPSMEAAFVDIGRGRNAVLYSGEVDWEAAQAKAQEEGKGTLAKRIELALKPGDRVLVQVTKDPVGHKGARLTSQISLPGRYLVYVPNGSMSGISRKLPDTERARLKRILKDTLPDSAGVIVRTAAEGATEEQLALDVQRLTNQWARIQQLIGSANAPSLLHSEPDLLVKIVRDVFNEDFQRLVIEGGEALQVIVGYLDGVAPDLLERVVPYEGVDSFSEYRVTEQIDKALDRKVWLPSGGSLVIDRTEAMTVVDVNTGKFVGQGGNLEETVTKNNLEAAEEIVRQLRLRDIGGIIVVDFIDMVLESNRDLVLRRLVECLSRDRTKHQVAEVTSLGLVQMTRKKIGLGLLETFSEPCEVCAGRGVIVHHEPVVKHKAADGGTRRGRGGRGTATVKNGVGSAGTHAITEDVRNALALVAKSTVGAVSTDTGTISVPEAEVVTAGAAAAAAKPVAEPEPKDPLDAVLEALPAPREPGQGRSRRRRASTKGVVKPDSDSTGSDSTGSDSTDS